jgi:putative ATPase
VDLFGHHHTRKGTARPPLAERMRPQTLAEYVGQTHLLGPGKLLTEAFSAPGSLPSIIFWGPPGSGKTTLAKLLAEAANARFAALSAVSAGVKDLRDLVADAARRRETFGERTILFVDEIHRFNKAQQDALLPAVESGTVTLFGATTENPSFEVVAALLSRSRVARLEALSEADLGVVIDRALADGERGLGGTVAIDAEARDLLAHAADGDARRALAGLEIAARVAAARKQPIGKGDVEEALQRKTLLYDRAGEEHYNIVSAFIKSLRGSDADAAVYWMTRMLEAGEDPLFILRRMVIFAAEDVGLADPRALGVAVSAMEAFRFIGLPEGVLPMTEAALYLATAPKSNTSLTTYGAARKDVLGEGALPVPAKLRNAPTPLMKEMGYGSGYRYPHDFEGNYVAEEYLPDALRGRHYYQPREDAQGYEAEVVARLERLRKK